MKISDWISIGEKMPVPYELVRVTPDFKTYHTAWFTGDSWDSGRKLSAKIKYWKKI